MTASHLPALNLGFSSFLDLSQDCEPRVRPKLGGPSAAEPGTAVPIGESQPAPSLSSLPGSNWTNAPGSRAPCLCTFHSPCSSCSSRHSLYSGSLLPGLSHRLCEAGHVAEKAQSQESTDGKAELKEGEVMRPGSYRWRERAKVPAQAPLLLLTPLKAALKTFPSSPPPATLPTHTATLEPFPTW